MLNKQGYMHARACTHARAHTQICNIYWFSTTTMIHERASLLRYTYIVLLDFPWRKLVKSVYESVVVGYKS
jgi:hypothetical protein